MDSWFTSHPDIYQNLLSAITPQVAMAPVLPVQVSPQAPKATQSRADKQDEYRALKGKIITSLLLARHSINTDGECIYVSGEINEAFEDTLLETPRNACKEYLQLIQAKVEVMKGSPTEGAKFFLCWPKRTCGTGLNICPSAMVQLSIYLMPWLSRFI
jgi:hypothetical protein